MKPRLFISAVTAELGHTRQLVANVLARLGYEPVWQDLFGLEPGDLRQVLRDKIDDCDGLIQIVGRGYGAEPPTVAHEFGRFSYTQFEFLYAHARGKKTWLIFAADGCTRDRPLEQLNLPHDPAHLDPVGYQTERRALQEAWRQRWQEHVHLRHEAANDTELELKVERLKDEFALLRRQFRAWQQNVTRNLVAVLILLTLVAGGVWWTAFRKPDEMVKLVTQAVAQQLEELQPERIREQLVKQIEATYQRDLTEAESLQDWRKRDEAKQAAAASRDRRLGQVDEFLRSITATIQSGDASPEFVELNRIMREQGVESALAYVTLQQSRLLELVTAEDAQHERQRRRRLAPLLEGVRLHLTRGELLQAEELCDKLLAADAHWPEALHEHFWTQIELGDRALRYETLSRAAARFQSAHASAEQLRKLDVTHPIWQRDLSASYNRRGNVQLQSGQATEALGTYQKAFEINQKLSADDPSDARTQRELSVSYNKLGDVQLQSGQVTEALASYQQGLAIRQKLSADDPSDVRALRDLSVSYNKLGNVQLQSGQATEALGSYQQGLEIRRKLAAADPSDVQTQRDLSISYNKLGDVQLQSGQVTEARGSYQKYLEISQKLAAADPSDVQAQRDLSFSYNFLGNVQLQSGQVTEALGSYQKYLEISQKLAADDPTDAWALRDLSISYSKLGDVQLQSGQMTEALGSYQKCLKINEKLVADDPNDTQTQRDLSIAYEMVGDVQLQSAQVAKALEFYLKAFEIKQQLAAADPSNGQAQFDLYVSFHNLGATNQQLKDHAKAIILFKQGLAVLERLEQAGRLHPSQKKWIAIVKERIRESQEQLPQNKK